MPSPFVTSQFSLAYGRATASNITSPQRAERTDGAASMVYCWLDVHGDGLGASI